MQLHCPPRETYYLPEVHEACGRLVQEGLVRAYGVSVEKVEDALKAIEFDGVATVQLIFNMLRQRPAELFFDQARRRDVGVIVRVPLASGLLTGKFDRNTTFAADDHREFNRHGEEFDVGETFSGVDYEVGLEVVEELRPLVPPVRRWPSSRCAGFSRSTPSRRSSPARRRRQARANAAAAELPAPSPETMERVAADLPPADRPAGAPALVAVTPGAPSCAPSTEAQTYGVGRTGPVSGAPRPGRTSRTAACSRLLVNRLATATTQTLTPAAADFEIHARSRRSSDACARDLADDLAAGS